MDNIKFQLKVLGTRGSMAMSGEEYSVFGGATSCYHIEAGEENIFLDAGSGLIKAPADFTKTPVIILTHLHLDHVLGLGMYPRLLKKDLETDLFMPCSTESEALQTLNALYSPPWWPLSLCDYAGDLRPLPLIFPFYVGDVLIEGMEGNHPGGCVVVRLNYREKSIVYITDYEHEDPSFSDLISFACGADLILYDGQYSNEEYEKKKGFGHSTASKGIELMKKSGAKRLLLIHHDPQSTDPVLLKREAEIKHENVHYAREGEVIIL